MSQVVDHRCLHCNYWKGDHKAETFNCPVKSGSRSFRRFSGDQFYEPNPQKPKTVPFTI